MPNDPLCTAHGKPARYSYCGGYWFCEDAYVDNDDDTCAVAADVELPDDEPTWVQVYPLDDDTELGGEG